MRKALSPEVEAEYFAPLEVEAKPRKRWKKPTPAEDQEARARAEGLDLEKLSDLNLIRVYGPVLREGGFSTLPDTTRRKLRIRGFIKEVGARVGIRMVLTEAAEELMREAGV